MLEHLRAVHTFPGAGAEGQTLRIRLEERPRIDSPLRLPQHRLGEVEAEASARGEPLEKVAGPAPHLEDAVARTGRQERERASDALALDVADERARMVVEALDVVLLDHRVVPRLEFLRVAEDDAGHAPPRLSERATRRSPPRRRGGPAHTRCA